MQSGISRKLSSTITLRLRQSSKWYDAMPSYTIKSRKNGQALIEFAFSIIILILLVLGFTEFGMAYWTSHAVSNASREGARIAAAAGDLTENDSRVKGAVLNYLKKSTLDSDEVMVTNTSGQDHRKVQVTVTYPYKWITPMPNFLGVDTLNICRKTTMRYCPYTSMPSNPTPELEDRRRSRHDGDDDGAFDDIWPDDDWPWPRNNPNLPNRPGLPDVVDGPTLPDQLPLPDRPSLPDRPEPPDFIYEPTLPDLPSLPDFSDQPRIPEQPRLLGLQNYPNWPI